MPQGGTLAQILLAQPSEMQRLGAAVERKRSPQTLHCDRDTLPALGQAFPPAPLLVDTCQSPLTAARGSAQSVGDAHPEGQLLCPMQGTRPLSPQQCSRHSTQWCSVPRLGHAATSHSGQAGKGLGVLAAGAEGSPVLTLAQGAVPTTCPPSAPQILGPPCPLLRASQKPRLCSCLFS